MFCMTCGTALTSNASFCQQCGKPVNAMAPSAAAPPLQQAQVQPAGAGPGPRTLPPSAAQIIDSDATVSMMLGIFALLGLHLLAAVPAIILGNRSLKRIRGSGGMVIGEGRAKAGVTMGWISIAFMALALLGLAVFFLVAVLHR